MLAREILVDANSPRNNPFTQLKELRGDFYVASVKLQEKDREVEELKAKVSPSRPSRCIVARST